MICFSYHFNSSTTPLSLFGNLFLASPTGLRFFQVSQRPQGQHRNKNDSHLCSSCLETGTYRKGEVFETVKVGLFPLGYVETKTLWVNGSLFFKNMSIKISWSFLSDSASTKFENNQTPFWAVRKKSKMFFSTMDRLFPLPFKDTVGMFLPTSTMPPHLDHLKLLDLDHIRPLLSKMSKPMRCRCLCLFKAIKNSQQKLTKREFIIRLRWINDVKRQTTKGDGDDTSYLSICGFCQANRHTSHHGT